MGRRQFPVHPLVLSHPIRAQGALQLKDRLTGTQSKLQIIPIVGMGGIGKTTLARNLYNDPLIISHFTTCAWVTISQDYNVRGILLGLLGCIYGKLSDELTKKKDHELKHSLYQELYGRRYLIVLDDMWDTNFWNDIRMYFPDTNNGSRIVLTTRGSDVAKHVDPQSPQHEVQLLNKLESWNLLYQKVFGEEDCPIVLQEIGRTWCVGLPFLLLESLNLVRWTAVETNFPGLRRLIIRDCSVLEEIPSGIGEIMTLQLIELEKCSPTAVESAKEIREVQYDYGNYELQLRIIS